MEGEVIIETPTPIELDGDQATSEGFLMCLIEYYNKILWHELEESDRIRSILLKQFKLLHI